MFFLIILVYVITYNSELMYPNNFLKQDMGVCLQNIINGSATYGSCLFTLHGFVVDLENPLCASFRGKIFLRFLTTNHSPILVQLDSFNDTIPIDFSSWHNCKSYCNTCNVLYRPESHVTVTSITSQLLASRQITTLTINNYNYQDCFLNDQTLDVFLKDSEVGFVAQLHPSYKCSMIPMSAIKAYNLILLYLDDSDNTIKQFLHKSIQPSSSILTNTIVLFNCKGECYIKYHSLVTSPFVFLYLTFNISLGNTHAILTNRLFGLTTTRYTNCFSYIRVVVSAKSISVYISRTVSTICPFNKTDDNVIISSVTPEVLVSGFRPELVPTRFSSPNALNLVDGTGVVIYDCPECMMIVHKGKTTSRTTSTLFESSIISDMTLTLHLDNGSIDVIRYPVNIVETCDWAIASVTMMSFMITFNATNTILRKDSATGTTCTHVQLIFVLNRNAFQDIFLEDIKTENNTILMPLIKRTGSLFANMKCWKLASSAAEDDVCTSIIKKFDSRSSMIYYQLMSNNQPCGKIYPVDDIIISSVFGPSIKIYGAVLVAFFVIVTFLFVCLIIVERYNNRIRSSES